MLYFPLCQRKEHTSPRKINVLESMVLWPGWQQKMARKSLKDAEPEAIKALRFPLNNA